MITIFTAVHGAVDVALRTFKAIEGLDIAPFVHLVGDDFSPPPDGRVFRNTAGWIRRGSERVGKRIVYHCRDLGATESPNLGASMAYAWDQARANESEALLIIESDVLPRPGIIAAFRQAQEIHGPRAGVIAPLYAEIGGICISSFGGMTVEKDFLGLQLCTPFGSWDDPEPRLDVLWWAHTACLWVPRTTLLRDDIKPDPDFTLFYCDHDLSKQVEAAGLDVVITDRAVAEHSRLAHSTGVRWPDSGERGAIEMAAYEQLKRKWA